MVAGLFVPLLPIAAYALDVTDANACLSVRLPAAVADSLRD